MLSIDITDKQLKLVKGSLEGNKIKVKDAETVNLPEETVVNGYITNIPPIVQLITETLARKKISEKEIVVCVNSSSILYKEIEVLKPKTLKNSAAIEAMIVTQMGISNDYNVSYSIVGEGAANAEGQATIKVMATACPQRMIDGYQMLFTQAGLKIKQINISNNCINRLVVNSAKLKENMPFLCIQVDDDFVNMNLYENGQVAISRYIKIDPTDYEESDDYVNAAVYDNLFRMVQFIGQRPNSQPLRQIMFYGVIRDFVALSNSISSFNIPSYVLSMPSNVVKFCDIDFAKYANAIGAFYKTDPLKDHVNLLEATAVKSQTIAGSDKFPLNALIVFLGSAVLVGGVVFALMAVNSGILKDIEKVEEDIADGRFEEKRAARDNMLAVQAGFAEYKSMVDISHTMYEFMPWSALPQMLEELQKGVDQVIANGGGGFQGYGLIKSEGYDVTVTTYCSDVAFPYSFASELSQLGFFENVHYEGFKTVKVDELEDERLKARFAGQATIVEFDLKLQLKAGHIFEANGNKYSFR